MEPPSHEDHEAVPRLASARRKAAMMFSKKIKMKFQPFEGDPNQVNRFVSFVALWFKQYFFSASSASRR